MVAEDDFFSHDYGAVDAAGVASTRGSGGREESRSGPRDEAMHSIGRHAGLFAGLPRSGAELQE
jgi:hypothetical protein